MIKISQVLKRAILSEKAYKQMEKGIYTFYIDARSTKQDVAKAVKGLLNVEATRINIAHVFAKAKRVGKTRKQTLVGGGKKAIVQLKAGQSIPMLSPKPEGKKTKKSTKEKDVQKISVEGREA